MIRKLVLGLAILLGLAVAVVVALPELVSLETYKPQILEQVKHATGRDIRIDGPMELSLFPHLALKLDDVGFSGFPETGGGQEGRNGEMVRLQSLELVLALRPLFSGDLRVTSFILEKPVIVLETDAKGQRNWELGRATEEITADTAPDGDPYLVEFSVKDAQLVDGTVTWLDRRSDTRETISGININVHLPGLRQPLEADGKLDWKAQTIALDLQVASVAALSDGEETRTRATVRSSVGNVDFDGTLRNDKTFDATGSLDLEVPSLRALAAWLGSPVDAPGETLGPLRLQGKLVHKGARSSLTAAKVSLDDIEAAGTLGLDTGAKRPRLDGKLVVDRLDLDPYFAGDARASGAPPAPGRGWSDKKIDVRALEALDLELDLSVAHLETAGVEVTGCSLTARLRSGRLTADLNRFSVYKGRGQGKVVLDGAQTDGLSAAVTVDLEGFDAEALLRHAAGSDRVSGTGTLDASIATRGRSERELMQSIQGKGRVDLDNGAIRGINLVAMVMHVASAFQASDPSARTEFSEMGGSFTISRGVLRNDDMVLKSPLIEVAGKGSVDLGQQTVDYRITPRVVTPMVGSLGLGTPGIMVPVFIRGPWGRIRYEPDVAGIIKQGFTAPVEGVLQVPGAIFEGGRKVVDPDYDNRQQPAPRDDRKDESAPGKAIDAIKGLFGR